MILTRITPHHITHMRTGCWVSTGCAQLPSHRQVQCMQPQLRSMQNWKHFYQICIATCQFSPRGCWGWGRGGLATEQFEWEWEGSGPRLVTTTTLYTHLDKQPYDRRAFIIYNVWNASIKTCLSCDRLDKQPLLYRLQSVFYILSRSLLLNWRVGHTRA